MRYTIAVMVTLTMLGGGCSHVEVKHVEYGDKSDGVHFYEPKPYLFVTVAPTKTGPGPNDVQNVYTSSIIWLPDPEKEYVAREVVLLGSVEESITLNNGWQLAAFGAKADSKIPETITALTGVAKLAAGGAASAAEGLYPIIFTNGLPTLGPKVPGW